MYFSPFLFINYQHTFDLIVVQIDAVYAAQGQKKHIEIDLGNSYLFKVTKTVL